jgi:hypothetical protein
MRVWIYVEGESDKLALQTLWTNWVEHLRTVGHGIRIIPLKNKSHFFDKIGPHAAEKLVANGEDIVVGLPDLYPNQPYIGTKFEHTTMEQLKAIQKKEVLNAIQNTFGVNHAQAKQLLERFFPSALKHDLEMLLLAAREELRAYLRTTDQLGNWRNPVEDQNQEQPPKRIVEELFITKSETRRAYRETKDASAILRKVTDIRTIIYDANRQIKCPFFKALLDWIGEKTTIPAYE